MTGRQGCTVRGKNGRVSIWHGPRWDKHSQERAVTQPIELDDIWDVDSGSNCVCARGNCEGVSAWHHLTQESTGGNIMDGNLSIITTAYHRCAVRCKVGA